MKLLNLVLLISSLSIGEAAYSDDDLTKELLTILVLDKLSDKYRVKQPRAVVYEVVMPVPRYIVEAHYKVIVVDGKIYRLGNPRPSARWRR